MAKVLDPSLACRSYPKRAAALPTSLMMPPALNSTAPGPAEFYLSLQSGGKSWQTRSLAFESAASAVLYVLCSRFDILDLAGFAARPASFLHSPLFSNSWSPCLSICLQVYQLQLPVRGDVALCWWQPRRWMPG